MESFAPWSFTAGDALHPRRPTRYLAKTQHTRPMLAYLVQPLRNTEQSGKPCLLASIIFCSVLIPEYQPEGS